MGGEHLGEFEHLVPPAVMRLESDAYGVPIRRLIAAPAVRIAAHNERRNCSSACRRPSSNCRNSSRAGAASCA